MNTTIARQIEILAKRPYTIEVMLDETTAGEPIYLVSHPELLGCMAQGESLEEAIDNLKNATKEFLMSLLEDGLPVPPPLVRATTTTTRQNLTYSEVYSGQPNSTFLDDLGKVTQPIKRQHLGTITLVEVG